jgi:hypothetical protein
MASRRKDRICQPVHVTVRHVLMTTHTCCAAVHLPCHDVIPRRIIDGICWRNRFPIFCNRWVTSEVRFTGCYAVYFSSCLRWMQHNFFSKSRLYFSVYFPIRMSSLPRRYRVPECGRVNVCMYMCVCVYVCMYICMYYVCMYVCMYVCIPTFT